MKLIAKRFLLMAKANGVSLSLIAKELGMSVERLKKMLNYGEFFTLTESRTLMAMFGADAMAKVIDWRVVNASRAF